MGNCQAGAAGHWDDGMNLGFINTSGPSVPPGERERMEQLGLTPTQYFQWRANPTWFEQRYAQYRGEGGKYNIPPPKPQLLPGTDQWAMPGSMRTDTFDHRVAPPPEDVMPGSEVKPGGAAGGGFSWGQQNPELGYWGLPKLGSTDGMKADTLKNFKNTNYFGLKNYGA
jgi:hypothetical protein